MFDFTRKASEVSNGVCSNCGFGVVCAQKVLSCNMCPLIIRNPNADDLVLSKEVAELVRLILTTLLMEFSCDFTGKANALGIGVRSKFYFGVVCAKNVMSCYSGPLDDSKIQMLMV